MRGRRKRGGDRRRDRRTGSSTLRHARETQTLRDRSDLSDNWKSSVLRQTMTRSETANRNRRSMLTPAVVAGSERRNRNKSATSPVVTNLPKCKKKVTRKFVLLSKGLGGKNRTKIGPNTPRSC